MQKWEYLKEGDLIDVIAPSSGAKVNLEEIKSFIESLGFRARINEDVFSSKGDPFHANDDASRFSQLRDALYAKDSKAIWCIRGGYGSSKLIDNLAKLEEIPIAKPIIGFSDITALHIFFNQNLKWASLHAKVLTQFLGSNYDADSAKEIKDLLTGKTAQVEYNLKPMNFKAAIPGIIEDSMIVGGNLCLVENSIGTIWEIEMQGKILFLEETGENAYRIDRMLEHLKQANMFDGVRAVILGDFWLYENEDQALMDYTLDYFAANSDFPVFKCEGFGHGKVNQPLPFGSETSIIVGENAHLVALSGGCAEAEVG